MQTLRSTAALALAAALVAMPLDAQDRPAPAAQQQARCTATISPAQVPAGQAAARLNVSFSEDVGELTRLDAGGSGIVLAQARDLPRTDLAANAPTPRPIAMGEQRNSWTVFVNTQNARPGSHGTTFVGANGGCTAQIQIQAGQQGAQPGQQPSGGAQPAQPGAQPRPGAQPGQQPSGGATQPTPPAGGSTRPSPTTPPTTPRPNN